MIDVILACLISFSIGGVVGFIIRGWRDTE